MGTPLSVIYERALNAPVNDEIGFKDANGQENLAVFYRRMWGYMEIARSKFTTPLGFTRRLAWTPPIFDDKIIVCDGINTTFDTGIFGMDVVVATNLATDSIIPSQYDSVTGEVTFEEVFDVGIEIDMDFYADGSFDLALDEEAIDILAHCLGAAWLEWQTNSRLRTAPKVKDSSFNVGSEANQIRADDARVTRIDNELQSKMLRYEQLLRGIRLRVIR